MGASSDADAFRLPFEQMVRRCMAAGLVGTEGAAIDASFVAAEASWQRKMHGGAPTAPRPARPARPVRE